MKRLKYILSVIIAISFITTQYIPVVQAAAEDKEILVINQANFVADSLNGVDAVYRPGRSDGSDANYSCAAFVKKYYRNVYGVEVYNLFSFKTPKCYGGETFKTVKKPKVGDIVSCISGRSPGHWAIVKSVNKDNSVTLIEQNWKWSQGGNTVTMVNRTENISNIKLYRLIQ